MIKSGGKLREFPAKVENHCPNKYFQQVSYEREYRDAGDNAYVLKESDTSTSQSALVAKEVDDCDYGHAVNHDRA